MQSILEQGSDWPMDILSLDERRADLLEALEFGNHKGISKDLDLLR